MLILVEGSEQGQEPTTLLTCDIETGVRTLGISEWEASAAHQINFPFGVSTGLILASRVELLDQTSSLIWCTMRVDVD